MTVKDFLLIILAGLVVWMFLEAPESQRSSQPAPVVVVQPAQPTAAYTIDTSQPTSYQIISPTWAAPTATATATAVPQFTSDSDADATPEPQRGERGDERGANSRRDD